MARERGFVQPWPLWINARISYLPHPHTLLEILIYAFEFGQPLLIFYGSPLAKILSSFSFCNLHSDSNRHLFSFSTCKIITRTMLFKLHPPPPGSFELPPPNHNLPPALGRDLPLEHWLQNKKCGWAERDTLGPGKRVLNVANVPATVIVTTPTWGTNSSYMRWADEGHLGAHRKEVNPAL